MSAGAPGAQVRRAVRLRLVMPRPRVMIGSLMLLLFISVLIVQAYINAEFTSDHVGPEPGDQATVPLSIRGGGPIINTTNQQERTHRLPERTIALTFDDGPDPDWTPQILQVLRDNDAHATFFVVGSQVTRHPDLVRRITADGHEVGVHTFTHPNLTHLAPWRRRLEYSQTQLAIARAAGVKTALLRFPYSSKPAAIDDRTWPLVKEAGALGYLVVVNDTDSQDWARPGVPQIVRNATPGADVPAVTLFHDAGGDRTQTIAALRTFIPRMKARGYRFTTVTEGLNIGLTEQAAADRTESGGTESGGTASGGTASGGTASGVGEPGRGQAGRGDRNSTDGANSRVESTRAGEGPAEHTRAGEAQTENAGAGEAQAGTGIGQPVPTLPQNPPAAQADIVRGTGLVWTVHLADAIVHVLAGLFVLVGVLTVGRTAVLLALATRHARQRRRADWSWGPPVSDPVSVIVPAYNEKEGIEAAVRSLAGGDYPQVEVVVVDDGSTDGTAALVEALRLPNVRVVRVPNGGKANALNTGVALARHELIVMVDGDTIFEPASIRRLVQPFANPAVGAVAGNVKVGNRGGLVALWQHIEYVIGFNLDRRLYEILRCMPTVPGAIGAFRRAALREVGGISDETLAEDTDVTMALCRAGWRVVYEESAKAWTEAPATLEQLYRQRYRWSYGTMQAMWKHRRALLDTGESGRFGRRGLPFLALFGVALPMLAPLVDIMLVYGLVFWDRSQTVLAWSAMLGLQTITAVVAFRFDHESLRPLWKLPLQQFAYRQLMYLVLIQSAVTALTGGRLRWHKLHRAGLARQATLDPAGSAAAGDPAGAPPVTPAPGPALALGRAALTRPAPGRPAPGRPAAGESVPAGPALGRPALGRPAPGPAIAPVVDTWPPVLGQYPEVNGHPAAGRATARPAVPKQPKPAVGRQSPEQPVAPALTFPDNL